jgi:hypothetical protein
MTHSLKCWPQYFFPMVMGEKRCEVRLDDRGFDMGDDLILREFRPCDKCNGSGRIWDVGDRTECGCKAPHGDYTGHEIKVWVSHILRAGDVPGIQPGYVVMTVLRVAHE